MNHHYQPTDHFSKKLRHLKKADPGGYRRVRKMICRLLAQPDDADGRMVGIYHGKLKKYVGRRDYRLIYEWCALCHKKSRKLEDRCEKCDEISDNSVVFFDVFHKNEV